MENKKEEMVQGTFKLNATKKAITHIHTRDGEDVPISCGVHMCGETSKDIWEDLWKSDTEVAYANTSWFSTLMITVKSIATNEIDTIMYDLTLLDDEHPSTNTSTFSRRVYLNDSAENYETITVVRDTHGIATITGGSGILIVGIKGIRIEEA